MKIKRFKLILLALLGIASNSHCQEMSVQNPLVEMRTNPIGVGAVQPRFSWQIKASQNNVQQSAYQLVAAESVENLTKETNLSWNTGKVENGNSVLIPYHGQALRSGKTYFWKVKVWTNKGVTPWSKPASWTMALLEASDWKAQWIGLDSLTNPGEHLKDVVNTKLSARYLRKEFEIGKAIKSGQLYISGLGMYECYLNGARVSNDIFAPTATDYDKHVNYNTYDVTSLLKSDQNTMGVVLGNGRFFSMRMANDKRFGIPVIRHFGFPKLLMQLEVEYMNGEKAIIASDRSWKLTTHGPIIANSEYDGEQYNANLELQGWNKNGFNDASWINARIVDAPPGKITAQSNPNIMTMEEIKPVSISEVNGKYILDMGVNMVGWLAVKLKGRKDQPVRMRFSETLNGDGSLYMANLRGAEVTNSYIPSKDGLFSWCPAFTYQGFRYAEISGAAGKPRIEDFTGKVNYDQMKTFGSFETSNELLNQIYKNACRGIKGNYRSFPTDCPQRDERMPWLGDRATGCLGESFIFDNNLLYAKWLQDIDDSQRENGSLSDVAPNYWQFYSDNITWPAAFIYAANMVYEQRGDTLPIIKHYPAMKKWLSYMKNTYLKSFLMEKDVYGDWCMPPERMDLIHSQDPKRKTDGVLLATAFYYRLLNLMARFATISGNHGDVETFTQLARNVKQAFNDKYLDTEKGQYGNNTVTANLTSIMQGLVPETFQDKVFASIVNKTEGEFNSHVGVGLIGIQFLMRGLTEFGRGDLAYKIATNRTYPSWGYMVDNKATTIWELWNGNTADPAMNSGNHTMLLGDLLAWYYENLAGIKTDKEKVGFRKIIMNPHFPEGLNHVKASTCSPYGEIRSEWTKTATGLNWDIEIPANSSALVTVPATTVNQVFVNDKKMSNTDGLTLVPGDNKMVSFQVGSGRYRLKILK
jgi:alpha-L-rhamnosidase